MISENFREKTVRIGRVRNLRRQISAEFRKDLFYENKVGPNLKNRPKFWWRHIKCLTGNKKQTVKATVLDPITQSGSAWGVCVCRKGGPELFQFQYKNKFSHESDTLKMNATISNAE